MASGARPGGNGNGSISESHALGVAAGALLPGHPSNRSAGHYGKVPGPGAPVPIGPGNPDPTGTPRSATHATAGIVRGSGGGMKKHPREGGIGPGPMGTFGTPTSSIPKDQE